MNKAVDRVKLEIFTRSKADENESDQIEVVAYYGDIKNAAGAERGHAHQPSGVRSSLIS